MTNNQDQTSRRIANQLRDHIIKPGVRAAWLKGMGSPQRVTVQKSRHQGATDAVIFEADVALRLFLKFSYDAKKEVKGYKLLSQAQWYKGHLVPPLFSELNLADNVMLMPYQETKELYELIRKMTKNEEEYIKNLYKSFLETSKNLWASTKSSNSSCNFKKIYTERIINRLDRMKSELGITDIQRLRFIINDLDCGTFEQAWNKFDNNISALKSTCPCTTHGDEHAKNILIFNEAVGFDENGWVIVDYLNAKEKSDWIFSIAKMLHWWQFYYVLELAKSKKTVKNQLKASWNITKDKRTLKLSYNDKALNKLTPRICEVLKDEVMKLANEVGIEFQEEQADWQKRLKLAMFSVIFASMPLHFSEADFAIPIMIHKSLKSLNDI